MPFHLFAFGEGFLLGVSLIIAIGAQNAFILKKGLAKEHVFISALLCTLIDLSLIIIGSLGLGSFFQSSPKFLAFISILGVAFLIGYGIKSLISGIKGSSFLEKQDNSTQKTLRATVLTILALSLLNPHVYLDTVVLLGGVSIKYNFNERVSFVIGACIASFVWFFSLAYGAGFLSGLFEKKRTWQVLDIAIACAMFFISYQLLDYSFVHYF